MRKLAIGCYAVLLVLLVAAPAMASRIAPEYQSSEPSDGAAMHEAPDEVEVTFSEPLDPGSSVTVSDACDNQVDDGATQVSGTTMSVGLEEKPSGRYLVEYVARGIGGLTGETEGSFSFIAHGGPACDGGKAGHQGHDPGDGNQGNGNHGSGNHGNGNRGTGNHGGADHDDEGHSTGSTGSGTDHSTMGTSGHTNGDAGASGSHSEGGHSGGTHDARPAASGPETIDGITSSDTQRELLTRADSTTLLISLALCAALGILGGVVLRATGAK